MMIKTENELLKLAVKWGDWKWSKLWAWAHEYQAQAMAWNEIYPPVKDDRRIFINTYIMVYTAIDAMSANPPTWICCAINHEMQREAETMDEILRRFDS